MSATIVCKDGTTLPAEVITAAACEANLRRVAHNARARAMHAARPEHFRPRWREANRRARSRKRGAA